MPMTAPISSAAAALAGAVAPAAGAATRDDPSPSSFKRYVRGGADPGRDAPEALDAKPPSADVRERPAGASKAPDATSEDARPTSNDDRPDSPTSDEPRSEASAEPDADGAAAPIDAATEADTATEAETVVAPPVPQEPAPAPTTLPEAITGSGLADGEALSSAPKATPDVEPQVGPDVASTAKAAAQTGLTASAPSVEAQSARTSDRTSAPVANQTQGARDIAPKPDAADAPALVKPASRTSGDAARALATPATTSDAAPAPAVDTPVTPVAAAAQDAGGETTATPVRLPVEQQIEDASSRAQTASASDGDGDGEGEGETTGKAAVARPDERTSSAAARPQPGAAVKDSRLGSSEAVEPPPTPATRPGDGPTATERAVDWSATSLAGRPQAALGQDNASIATQASATPAIDVATPDAAAPDADALGRVAPPIQLDPAAADAESARPADAASQLALRRFANAMSQQQPTAQVAFSIARNALEARDRIRMQLYPHELGKVEVTMDIQDDRRVEVVVRAERPETMELLQKDARELQRALQNAGLDVGAGDLSFEFGGQASDRDGESEDGAGPGGGDIETSKDGLQPPPAPRWRAATPGGVDLVA